MAKYKRRTFIIIPKFQLTMSLFITATVLVTSLVYFLVIDGLTESISVIISELGGTEAAFGKLIRYKSSIVQTLLLYQALVCAIVFVGCVLFTHRMAGPIFKLRRFLKEIQNGAPRTKLFFRKGDCFHEVAHDVNSLFDFLSENYKKDFVYVSEVNAYLKNLKSLLPEDKQATLEEISQKLLEIQNRFHEKEEN